MDLRIEKTRKTIINTFIELRARKPIEKITIKELCEKAMINISTFYSHYRDIYELSDAIETEVVNSILQSLSLPYNIFENPDQFTRELFMSYHSQESLLQTLFSGSRSSRLVSKIDHGIKELVFAANPEARNDLATNLGLTYAIYGTYYAYMENTAHSPQQVIEILARFSRYVSNLLQGKPVEVL